MRVSGETRRVEKLLPGTSYPSSPIQTCQLEMCRKILQLSKGLSSKSSHDPPSVGGGSKHARASSVTFTTKENRQEKKFCQRRGLNEE